MSVPRWTVNWNNHSGSSCAGDAAGIPAATPKWESLKCAKWGAGNQVCAVEDAVYINSAGRICVALNIETGKTMWDTEYPHPAIEQFCVGSKAVCVAPYLLHRDTGEIIADLSSEDYEFGAVDDVLNDVFYVVVKAPEKGILRIGEAGFEFFSIPAAGVTVFDNGKRVLGSEVPGRLVCYDVGSRKRLWAMPYGLSETGKFLGGMNSLQMLFDDRVYQHLFIDTLRCIDVNTGNILWVSGPERMGEEEYNKAKGPSRYLGCADALYQGREYVSDGYLQARSAEDGRVLWRVDAPDARMFLTAGDLLFGALDDVPAAWDRHTGQVVWRAEKRLTAVSNAVAAGNKVIYSNAMSQMRCYEWDVAYVSTAWR